MDCARRLKELMPSHKVRCRTTWAGGGRMAVGQVSVSDLGRAGGRRGAGTGPTELDRMAPGRPAGRERAVTDKRGSIWPR